MYFLIINRRQMCRLTGRSGVCIHWAALASPLAAASVSLSSTCLDSWLGACSHMEGALTPHKLLTAKTFKSQVVRWPAKESHCHCRGSALVLTQLHQLLILFSCLVFFFSCWIFGVCQEVHTLFFFSSSTFSRLDGCRSAFQMCLTLPESIRDHGFWQMTFLPPLDTGQKRFWKKHLSLRSSWEF